MNKSQLHIFFDMQISLSAIHKRYGEWVIVGKFCIIAVEDSLIEIWLCNTKDIAEGLGTRSIKNRLDALKSPSTTLVRELTGEGLVRTRCKQDVLTNLKLLGIRKARSVSEAQRQGFIDRMQPKSVHQEMVGA